MSDGLLSRKETFKFLVANQAGQTGKKNFFICLPTTKCILQFANIKLGADVAETPLLSSLVYMLYALGK